jgi:hypothetical protein
VQKLQKGGSGSEVAAVVVDGAAAVAVVAGLVRFHRLGQRAGKGYEEIVLSVPSPPRPGGQEEAYGHGRCLLAENNPTPGPCRAVWLDGQGDHRLVEHTGDNSVPCFVIRGPNELLPLVLHALEGSVPNA